MLATQKKQYALRAIFELAKRSRKKAVKTSEIAESQAIPVRFLEVILSRLKRKGLVQSKRGIHGGYTLAIAPEEISVGHIFRLLEDTEKTSDCISCTLKKNCPFIGECVFMDMWSKAHEAMYAVYDETTIQSLIDNEKSRLLLQNH